MQIVRARVRCIYCTSLRLRRSAYQTGLGLSSPLSARASIIVEEARLLNPPHTGYASNTASLSEDDSACVTPRRAILGRAKAARLRREDLAREERGRGWRCRRVQCADRGRAGERRREQHGAEVRAGAWECACCPREECGGRAVSGVNFIRDHSSARKDWSR